MTDMHTIGGMGAFGETDIKRLSIMVQTSEGWPIFIEWFKSWTAELRDQLEVNQEVDVNDTVAKLRVLRAMSEDLKQLPEVLERKLKEIEADRKAVEKAK